MLYLLYTIIHQLPLWGEIVDRVGMSEEFQKLVSEANEYGTLISSNVLMNI